MSTEWFEGRSVDEQKHERCFWRRVGFVIFAALALAMLLAPLGGCAERILTVEQDAEMKAACDEVGCTVIPNPIWRQMESILKRHGAI